MTYTNILPVGLDYTHSLVMVILNKWLRILDYNSAVCKVFRPDYKRAYELLSEYAAGMGELQRPKDT
jgi:hypothetical protein